jgi:cardiolipin synthase
MFFDYLFSLITLYLLVATVAAIHVLLCKRNSRAAFGWLGLIIVFPIAGALLYALFGVNRVQRKAQRVAQEVDLEPGQEPVPQKQAGFASLDQPGLNVTGCPLIPGNDVHTYYSGETAYPAMLDAIDSAHREVFLSSYIFDNDETGRRFVESLAAAHKRGCQVCILVDDVGIRYSFPTIIRELKRHNLPFRRFMPLRILPPSFSINLRTHRKLLIVDRQVCFAGGMNIGDRQLVDGPSPHRASDLHFRFEGPLTPDCVRLFADDWQSDHESRGAARCRLVSDGPDETLDSLMLVIMGAISSAERRVWIMTPYFLPERQMMGCLQAAALSGVDVRVMIPEKNNWPLVQWALQHYMSELLQAGVRISQRPPPFAHSKCMVIDDVYVLVGSSNLDPRSLRLNFELGIEVFDEQLNSELATDFEQVLSQCSEFTIQRLRQRGNFARLRDGASALFSPYL